MSCTGSGIDEMPVAVLDFETTGLSPRTGARVVEVGVARVDPGSDPKLVLDTLVDPEGPVHATDVHGIRNEDVVGAPKFRDIIGALIEALDGAVVMTYNATFDIAFLQAELERVSRRSIVYPPHICLMWLRPLLGLGKRASLCETCESFGLPGATHAAGDDATLAAYVWLRYREHALKSGWRTFGDFAALGTHKYLKTLSLAPYARSSEQWILTATATSALQTRKGPGTFRLIETLTDRVTLLSEHLMRALSSQFGKPPLAARRRAYWHSMIAALADGTLSDNEIDELRLEQQKLALADPEVKALHSRYVGQRLLQMVEDQSVDRGESDELRALFNGMRRLGWAPGD